MIAEKIRSTSMALGVLAGQMPPEQYELIRLVRAELADAADTAEEMESRLKCPCQEEATSPCNSLGSLLAALGGRAFSPVYTKDDLRPRPRPGLSLVIIGPKEVADVQA